MRGAEAGAGEARARLRIRGRVQGVYYRASTREEALRLGVRGWVRNLADGGVEVLCEGPRAGVDALCAWCGRGPAGARVDVVEVAWEAGGEALVGFEIRR